MRVVASIGALLIASWSLVSVQATTEPASQDKVLKMLPSFGVSLPDAPDGFHSLRILGSGLLSSTVAGWESESTNSDDEHRSRDEDQPTHSQIWLFWRPLVAPYAPRTDDAFREAARNPFGSAGGGNDSFPATSKEVAVPRSVRLPTARFERPDGTPDSDDFIVRSEVTVVNNLAYVTVQIAPDGEAAAASKAAFDEIVAKVHYHPVKSLGRCLQPTDARRPVPNVKDVTFRMLEPFRAGEGDFSATAYDLTMYTQAPPDNIEFELEDYVVYQYFAEGGNTIPQQWIKGIADPKLKGKPDGWFSDEKTTRIAQPLANQSHRRTAFLGGKRVSENRWVWIVMFVPQRIVTDAGGENGVLKSLESTLETIESN